MRRQRYFFRQLVWLIFAVAFPLLALLGYNVYQDAQHAHGAAYQAVENYATVVAQDAESLLADTHSYLAYLAERPLVRALDEQTCDPVLGGVLQRRRSFANVFVTDLEGRPVCFVAKGPGSTPSTLASFAWFERAAASDEMTLSQPFRSPIAQRQVVAMSVPIYGEPGRRIGTVTALLDLEAMQAKWARYVLPPGSRLTVLDGGGTILVTRPDFASMVGGRVGPEVADALTSDSTGVNVAAGSDGIERAFALKPIGIGGWRASAAIPAEQLFAEYRAQLRRSIAIGSAVLIAVLALAVWMARRLAAPLTHIGNAARAVARGDQSVRASESLPGEFHHVAREFNAMLDASQAASVREKRHADFYKALSRTNGAIVRVSDAQSLYEEICRICVEEGHASIAYVSLRDGAFVKPVAWAGPAEAFVASFDARAGSASVDGPGLTSEAIRTGERQVANDSVADARTAPRRDLATAIGTRAVASFPFRRGDKVVGALSLHMTVEDFFDKRVVDLVDEMASDVSFALDNFDREKARAAAELEAGANSRRFRMLFQSAPVSMSIVGMADQRLLDVNETFGSFTGQSPQALIGRNAFEEGLWPGDEERVAFLEELRTQGRVRNFELHAKHVSGGSRDYLLQADPIEFDDQPCVLTIANDITDLRLAQRRLDEREKQLSGLVDTAMDAIVSIDASHRVVLFNRAAAEMFLVPADEAIGSDIERFIPSRLRVGHVAHVQEFARTGTARRMGGPRTLTGQRSDGTEFPVEASISKLGQDASVLMTVVIRDATEKLLAEQAVLARVTAESASRAKTEFLSRMSHELRTPLNAVLGFSQLLQGDRISPLSVSQYAHVEHIRRAGWHLLALINDVLDVSKIEAGKVKVEGRAVDLLEVVDEAVRINEGAAEQLGIAIVTAYRRNERSFVWADPGRLRQVMINLLSNAIKYNRPGGRVEVRVSVRGERTFIDVDDTGLGMTAEQVQHLYEPFNRLGRERNGIEGTGLGLALTRQLVLLMQGQIDVKSEMGIGTRMRVDMPTHQAAPASDFMALPPQPEPALDKEAAPSGVVLYIEDNPVNLLLVEQLLLRWPGVLLMQAENGRDGLAMARTTPPDLILLDMRLPDMDGLAVLDALKRDETTSGYRVVALSASAMPDEIAAARQAGAFDYWTKPLEFDHFLREVRRLLRSSRARTDPPH